MKYVLKLLHWTSVTILIKLHKRVPISAFLSSEHTVVREQVLYKVCMTDRDDLAQEEREEGVICCTLKMMGKILSSTYCTQN